MRFLILILTLAGLITLGLAAAAADLPHKVEIFQYSGTLGGYEVQLNGTVQEIYAQMQKLYPDFQPELAVQNNTSALDPYVASASYGLLCWPIKSQPWDRTPVKPIYDGIWYLRGLDLCNVGGNSCARISCSYGGAIYLCNDNPDSIAPYCPYLASYAQDIVSNCRTDSRKGLLICGQEFDPHGYNIIVRRDKC